MEEFNELESPFDDHESSDGLFSEDANSLSEGWSVAEMRARRIEEYQIASLEKFDPLESLLGASSAGLFEMAGNLEDRINAALAESPDDLAAIKPILEGFDVYLRVTRQIDRFTQLEIRSDEARAKLAEAHGRPIDPLREFGAKRRYRK